MTFLACAPVTVLGIKPANGSMSEAEEIEPSVYLCDSGRWDRYGFSFGVEVEDDEVVEVVVVEREAGLGGGGPGGGPGGAGDDSEVEFPFKDVFAFFEGRSFSFSEPILH